MAEYRVYLDVFKVTKDLLKNCTSYVGIDRGCSLTKVVIVPKSTVSEDDTVLELHCSSFLNKHFDKALEYIKAEAYLTDGQQIHVTGAGCDMFRESMEETLGRKSCFVDEFFSQIRGSSFLLRNLSDDQLFHPWVHLDEAHVSYDRLQDITASQRIKDITEGELKSDVKHFPLVFIFLGSAAGIVPMYEDLRPTIPSFTGLGGRCFLGLGRVLLGTGDYLEIIDLANKGRNALDICLDDLLETKGGSEKSENPSFYPFGKLEDTEQEVNREDVALSLVRLVASNIATHVANVCRVSHLTKVVFGGNLGRAEIFRVSLIQAFAHQRILDSLDVRFLKTGHTGAIGAMTTDPKDVTMSFFGPTKKN